MSSVELVSTHTSLNLSITLVLIVVAVLTWLYLHRIKHRRPPGPLLFIPGIGQLLNISKHPIKNLRAYRQQYGDIFQLYMGTYPIIVVSGMDTVTEVLHTRGYEFTSRAPSFIARNLANNKGLLNTSGRTWIEQRRNVIKSLKMLAASEGLLEDYIMKATDNLSSVIKNSVVNGHGNNLDLTLLLKKSVFSISFAMAYGRFLDFNSDLLDKYLNKYIEFFSCLNLAVLTTFLPGIHLVPGDPVGYNRCKALADDILQDFVRPELERLKNMYNNNQEKNSSGITCIAGVYIEDMIKNQVENLASSLTEDQLPITISDVVAGNFDTLSVTLQWILLYLVHYPHVQDRCRQEINEQIATKFNQLDLCRLVYTQAMIMEVQRHANIVPMPPNHSSDKDCQLRGFFIPKNTAIIINTDSLLNGPEVGNDSELFRPERFIGPEGKLINPKWFITFSAGKRICPGLQSARKELLGFIVKLLGTFYFSPPKINGFTSLPSMEGVFGITHSPKPFSVSVTCTGQ